MSRRTFRPLPLALVFAASSGVAQTRAPIAQVTTKLSPYVATASFAPYAAMGMLGNQPINLSLERVAFNMNAHLDGKVMFSAVDKSAAYLNSPSGVANGTYSVQLDFASVSQPATVTISLGNTPQATCVVTSAALSCGSGTFAVTNGQLNVAIAVTQGYQANLAKVTVNQLR